MKLRAFLAAAFSLAVLPAQTPLVSTDQRIAALELRLKRAPANAALREQLAGAFLQKMRETADGAYLERAARLVGSILQTEPSHYAARRRALEIEMQRHHFREIVAAAGALTRERPGDGIAWGLLGDAQMELGDYDGAAGAYERMADLQPGLASYNRIAYYRFVTGDAEGAIEIMRKGISIGSPAPENLAWCLTDLAAMLFKTGAAEEAERTYRQALAVFPGYHPALAGAARVAASRGRLNEAIRLLAEAHAKAPFPEYTGLLASLYRKAGKAALADKQIALLDVTDKLERAAGQATNRNLALALADLDHNVARALELARTELGVRTDVYTWDALAWALYKNGETAEAADAMRKALAQNTPEPMFHEHAARIFASAGLRADAE